MAKETIIIGGGIGGLALAARLLKQGHRVTIVEKNSLIGGKASEVCCGDYQFDGGPTVLMMPQEYLALFEDTGVDYQQYFHIKQLVNNYKVFYAHKTPSTYSGQLNDVINQLEAQSTDLSHGYLDYLADTYGKYLFMDKYFLNQNYTGRFELFKPRNMKTLLKMRPVVNVDRYLRHYIHEEDFLHFLLFQAMYLGVSPYQGANVISMIPAMTQMYGLWYISGGMNGYIQSVAKLVQDLGGDIVTGTEVEEIVIAGKQAIGVKTASEVLLAENIVCNADYAYCLAKLLPPGAMVNEGFEPEDAQFSCSTFMVYLVSDQKYPQLDVHNILINDHFKKGLQAPFQGKNGRKLSLYVYCPTRVDEDRVPSGYEMISVTVRVPNLDANPQAWHEKQKKKMMKRVIGLLETQMGLTDLSAHLVEAYCRTPRDMDKDFHCYEGASFGLSPLRRQSGMFRPSVKAKSIEGLYFVGDSIQPGAGMSLVLKSAKLVAEQMMADQRTVESTPKPCAECMA